MATYVPIACITIHKKTDSATHDAVYTLSLYKQLWRNKCERVSISKIDASADPMMRIGELPGKDAYESEEARLVKKFGARTFYMIYPGESFRQAFDKVAKDSNPWLEKHESRKAAAWRRAKAEARGVVIMDSEPAAVVA